MQISPKHLRSQTLYLWLGVCVLLFAEASNAWGTATYSFVSSQFTTFYNTSCPPTCNITGTFTLAQPLQPNLMQNLGGSGSFTPLSFSFTDGVTTFTNLNPGESGFNVDTDSHGNIIYWGFYTGPIGGGSLFAYDAGPGYETQEGVNLTNYQAYYLAYASGGTWTTTVTSTPEPSGLGNL